MSWNDLPLSLPHATHYTTGLHQRHATGRKCLKYERRIKSMASERVQNKTRYEERSTVNGIERTQEQQIINMFYCTLPYASGSAVLVTCLKLRRPTVIDTGSPDRLHCSQNNVTSLDGAKLYYRQGRRHAQWLTTVSIRGISAEHRPTIMQFYIRRWPTLELVLLTWNEDRESDAAHRDVVDRSWRGMLVIGRRAVQYARIVS